jgi:hypothetical protein
MGKRQTLGLQENIHTCLISQKYDMDFSGYNIKTNQKICMIIVEGLLKEIQIPGH